MNHMIMLLIEPGPIFQFFPMKTRHAKLDKTQHVWFKREYLRQVLIYAL